MKTTIYKSESKLTLKGLILGSIIFPHNRIKLVVLTFISSSLVIGILFIVNELYDSVYSSTLEFPLESFVTLLLTFLGAYFLTTMIISLFMVASGLKNLGKRCTFELTNENVIYKVGDKETKFDYDYFALINTVWRYIWLSPTYSFSINNLSKKTVLFGILDKKTHEQVLMFLKEKIIKTNTEEEADSGLEKIDKKSIKYSLPMQIGKFDIFMFTNLLFLSNFALIILNFIFWVIVWWVVVLITKIFVFRSFSDILWIHLIVSLLAISCGLIMLLLAYIVNLLLNLPDKVFAGDALVTTKGIANSKGELIYRYDELKSVTRIGKYFRLKHQELTKRIWFKVEDGIEREKIYDFLKRKINSSQ